MGENISVFIRLEFTTEQECYSQFHSFPPSNMECVLGWSRKRAGRAQMIRLDVESVGDANKFIEECNKNPAITQVQFISEKECWEAPSNAI